MGGKLGPITRPMQTASKLIQAAPAYTDIVQNTGSLPLVVNSAATNEFGLPVGTFPLYIVISDASHVQIRDYLAAINTTGTADQWKVDASWVCPIAGYGYVLNPGDVVAIFAGAGGGQLWCFATYA